MDFYKRKQRWKYILFTVAVVISSLSIYLTSSLENSLEESNIELEESINSLSQSIETLHNNHKTIEKQEKENMELLAKAIKNVSKMGIEEIGDFSFSLEIIRKNTNIPLIVVDSIPTLYKNLTIPEDIENNPKLKNEYLLKELSIMRSKTYDSIIIDVLPNKVGDEQILYYGNSDILKHTDSMHVFTIEKQLEIKEKQQFTQEILNEMKWYPLYQLSFICLFFLLAYLIFNAARRSEQNQVWAGMAKETAHQIGTPLSSLMAWVELLEHNEENKSMTIEMQKDLKRLETITERFSKIGSKTELNPENIEEIIDDSVSYMSKRFSKNIHFKKNFTLSNNIIYLNKVLFIWVIENICKNAADAMKGEGKISINCTEDDKNIQLYISDTGNGIDKNIIQSIFMPGITSKKRGWGLGLSLVKRIIEDYHKGKIYVENSTQEDGTTFCILLPKKSDSTTS